MKDIDQGLGAVGLLALATALAVLLTIGTPIILAPDPIKVSDWLGFAGSVLGAMITLGAAFFAWRAVQGQISAQREQMQLDALIRVADRIEYHILPGLTLGTTILNNAVVQIAPTQPKEWILRLGRVGLNKDPRELREHLEKLGGGQIPSDLRDTIVNHVRWVRAAAKGVEDCERQIYYFSAQDKVTRKSDWERAEQALADAKDIAQTSKRGLSEVATALKLRRDKLHTQLERYRARIDAVVAQY